MYICHKITNGTLQTFIFTNMCSGEKITAPILKNEEKQKSLYLEEIF